MRITFKGDKAVKDLDATIKNIQSRVPTILEEIGVTAIGNIQHSLDAIQPFPPNNIGTLRGGITFDPVTDNTLRVHDSVEYGKWVQTGTPKHYIPIKVLIQWCKEKGMITNDKDIGIAYAIQNHIAKYGIPSKPFFSTGVAMTEAAIPSILKKYYK